MMDGGVGFTHGAGGFLGILFWIILIALVVFAVSRIAGSGSGSRTGGKSALEILDERYAHGEIDQQEYEQKRRDIRQQGD